MGKIMADKHHYSPKAINKTGATYRVIYGQRGPGKTFSILFQELEHWWKDEKRRPKLGIVRRMDEDFVGANSAKAYYNMLMDDANHENNVDIITKGQYQGVEYYNGRYWLTQPGEDGKMHRTPEVVAYGFSISSAEHYKGTRYNDIDVVLFDEFVATRYYLPDEFVQFQNLLSTIIGNRPGVIIYMLGNTINPFCPYFKEMGLTRVREQKPGTIDVYTYGDSQMTVAVEHTGTVKATENASRYFAFENPKLRMITNVGDWAIDVYPHCPAKYRPMDVVFTFLILFDEKTYQGDVIDTGDLQFLYIHAKTTDIQDPDHDLIYSLERDPRPNWRVNVLKPILPVEKKIAQFFAMNRVYYQDNAIGNAIENYLKQARLITI